MLGVSMYCCPKKPRSPYPKSSARIKMTLGLVRGGSRDTSFSVQAKNRTAASKNVPMGRRIFMSENKQKTETGRISSETFPFNELETRSLQLNPNYSYWLSFSCPNW